MHDTIDLPGLLVLLPFVTSAVPASVIAAVFVAGTVMVHPPAGMSFLDLFVSGAP